MSISTGPSATVRIPSGLLSRTGGAHQVAVSGGTVREIIESLDREYPGLLFNLCYETGELREFVNVFLETENVRYLGGLDTAVPPGAKLYIFHSVAGGSDQ